MKLKMSRLRSRVTHPLDTIFISAIESAKKHSIKLKPRKVNEAAGNCSYEAVIHNINDRDCFHEISLWVPNTTGGYGTLT